MKDSDGSVTGCHPSEAAADKQLAALYATESDVELVELVEEVVDMAKRVVLGGKPNPGTPKDKRLKENTGKKSAPKKMPSDMPRMHYEAYAADASDSTRYAPWAGVLTKEGVETGDGREFAPDSLEWDLSHGGLPLQYQRESQPQHMASVVVGRIDTAERLADGDIWGTGVIDLATEYGAEVANQLPMGSDGDGTLGGISVDVDSVKDADVELVFPQDGDEAGEDEDGIAFLFGPPPEKVVFHRGRIRGATLVALPAFIEARIHLTDATPAEVEAAIEEAEAITASAILRVHEPEQLAALPSHDTATSTGSWDGGANEKRLSSPMPIATARGAYAWVADGAVEDGEVRKTDLKFIHHEVSADGNPGAANLTACSTGIGVLNGGRGGTTIPASDRRGVYNHLAQHLRDAGREPPELMDLEDVLVASGGLELPELEWFANPKLTAPIPWTVDDELRVYGHLALWGTCHTTFGDRCVTPPKETDFPYFHLGELRCNHNGKIESIGVGHVTLGTGHAPASLSAAPAAEHYDNTGHTGAQVRVGPDQFGIWCAGAIAPGLAERHVRALRGASLSGDWRRIGGSLHLVGILAVNVPGFPIPSMRARMSADDLLSLTAAGVVTDSRVALLEEAHTAKKDNTIRIKRPVEVA